MRVLIVKMSSMGDVVHTLPALTEARAHCPDLVFDWVVEEGFAEIPGWHPAVDRVIPIALRRWRKQPGSAFNGEWREFRRQLQAVHYDRIIDPQGLLKSALVSLLVSAPRYGYDRASIREAMAALFYQHRFPVSRELHAITRIRQLFGASFGYTPAEDAPIALERSAFFGKGQPAMPTLVFLHGTSREDKLWPEQRWVALGKQGLAAGYRIRLLWGSDEERQRAERIADALASENAQVMPRLNLSAIAEVLARAEAVVSVDTGLGHLAAALGVPGVALYGPTDPVLVGTHGPGQLHLQAADNRLMDLDEVVVWEHLVTVLPERAA